MDSEFNEKGYMFIPDVQLTLYVQKEKYMMDGHVQKGIPGMIVLQIHHKEKGHVSNLLFDTKTQTPVEEIPLGESGWCKLDMIRLKHEFDEKQS